jgi:hypothetical protein
VAVFGYFLAVRQARGPRERAFALRATLGSGLLAGGFPWLVYGLLQADPTVQSLGWWLVGAYLVHLLVRRWRENQLRIRQEESRGAQTRILTG